MDAIGQLCEQARNVFAHHAPQDITVPAVMAAAVVMLVFGAGVAVLGARMARMTLTLAFIGVGLVGGFLAGGRADLPLGVAVPVGGIVLGVLGFVLHRLWVGVAASLILMAALSGTYGAKSLMPDLQAYEVTAGPMPSALRADATASQGDEPSNPVNPAFAEWIRGFGDYVRQNDPGGIKKLAVGNFGVGLFGLVCGLIAVRFTLVTMTSLLGTVMMASGAMALAHRWQPDLYQAGVQQPNALAVAMGVVLVGSLVLQTLLTRPDKPAAKPAKS